MGTTNLDTLLLSEDLTVDDKATITGGLGLGVTTAIAAAGSNSQANSTALTSPVNIIATVSATTRGVRLPTADAGDIVIVKNKSATGCNVYPATGAAVNALSADAAYDLAATTSVMFVAESATLWHTV